MSGFATALEVGSLPPSASIDDLSVLVRQFQEAAAHRILLSSPGVGPGTALVLLPPGADAALLAELLDGHPIAGGLLEVSVCADPFLWMGRHMLGVSRAGAEWGLGVLELAGVGGEPAGALGLAAAARSSQPPTLPPCRAAVMTAVPARQWRRHRCAA